MSNNRGALLQLDTTTGQDNYPELENQPQPYGQLVDEMAARKIDYYFGLLGRLYPTRRMAEVFKERYDGNLQKRNQMKILDMRNFDSALLFEYVREGLSRSVLSFMKTRR
jgi:hypothetical protein